MTNIKIKVESLGYIEALKLPVNKSKFTDNEDNAQVFLDEEYITEKLRGSLLDGHYEIIRGK